MSSLITCPNCSTQFELGDDIKKKYQADMKAWQLRLEEKYKQKEADINLLLQAKETEAANLKQALELEFNKKMAAEKQQLQSQIKTNLTQQIQAEFENKLLLLQQNLAENNAKLENARKKELEFLQLQQALATKEQEIDLVIQQKMVEQRTQLAQEIQKIEAQKLANLELEYKQKIAEKEMQLEQQKQLAEQMRKKAEQGSMQLQGEVQEVMLEELLKQNFVFDAIEPVGKGIRGADCIQKVHNKFGHLAGSIIYESKRTKEFGGDWIEKLKTDMRNVQADVAVIVTQTLPKDMDKFGEKDGVYICTFNEVASVATILRNAILKIHDLRKSQENKGDKMVMLYNYLTGNEFVEQWTAMREGFLLLKQSIQKERDVMEKIWKAREKQLEKILLNATHIQGSVEGIAGKDGISLGLIDDVNSLDF
ncbi:MAG: DUF2130 domain-containing protein [Chitinophagaceae bacterium]